MVAQAPTSEEGANGRAETSAGRSPSQAFGDTGLALESW